jgi:hypothetical protein
MRGVCAVRHLAQVYDASSIETSITSNFVHTCEALLALPDVKIYAYLTMRCFCECEALRMRCWYLIGSYGSFERGDDMCVYRF